MGRRPRLRRHRRGRAHGRARPEAGGSGRGEEHIQCVSGHAPGGGVEGEARGGGDRDGGDDEPVLRNDGARRVY